MGYVKKFIAYPILFREKSCYNNPKRTSIDNGQISEGGAFRDVPAKMAVA